MKKTKVEPRAVPPEDSQGHAYQYELGDPRKAQQMEESLKDRKKAARKPVSKAKFNEITPNPGKPVVLITGSGGMIGTALVKSLSKEYTVVGLDLKGGKQTPAGTQFVACDLTNDRSVTDALRYIRLQYGSEIASVVHLAAHYDFSGEPSEMYERLTIQGTSRLLNGLQDFKVEQFVFSSTILVMAPTQENAAPLKETSPLEPEPWDYPRSKIDAENVIRRERGKIPAAILRIAGVYDEFGHAVPIAQQIYRIYHKQFESHFFPGDADHGQPFIHLKDLVECVRQVIERRRELDPLEIFLIAEPELMSYRDLQDEIGILLHGEEWKTIWIPKLMAKAGAWAKNQLGEGKEFIKPWMIDLADDHYPVSIDHARHKLGWQPQHRLRDELPRIIDRLKEDPEKWFKANKLPLPEQKSA
jgi:nucleoside-diphosphate-sugar epimerase